MIARKAAKKVINVDSEAKQILPFGSKNTKEYDMFDEENGVGM